MINLINKITPNQDKLMHFFWGFLIFFFSSILITDNLIVIGICLVFAVAKEIRDYFSKGTVEVLDIIFTVAPSILIYILKII